MPSANAPSIVRACRRAFSSSGAIDGIENWIEFLDALKVQIEKFLRARLGLGKQPFRLHDRQVFRSSNRHPSPRNFSYFTEVFGIRAQAGILAPQTATSRSDCPNCEVFPP
jgi:hypothetical protein